MSHTCKTKNCGCADKGLTTNPPCTTNTTACPTPNPCGETFSSDCIIYTNAGILYNDDIGIPANIPVSEAIQILFDLIKNNTNESGLVYLHAPAVTMTSINLAWNVISGETTGYEVYIRPAGPGAYTLVTTVTTPYTTIAGLTTNTSYDFYVKGVLTGIQSLVVRITTL